jgi:hypothetical protein
MLGLICLIPVIGGFYLYLHPILINLANYFVT